MKRKKEDVVSGDTGKPSLLGLRTAYPFDPMDRPGDGKTVANYKSEVHEFDSKRAKRPVMSRYSK